MQRRVVGRQRASGGGGVGRLRVVDVADAVDLGDELEPVRDAGEGPQRARRSPRRRARPRGPPRSRRRRSRGCARRESTARPAASSSAANSTRRAARERGRTRAARPRRRRGPGSRRCAASRRGRPRSVPCRSRWSGSRLRSTAIRGRKLSTSSSWKHESSQTIHSSAGTSPTSSLSAVPTFPAVPPPRPNIAPSSSVVVVLPFVPVTPTTGFGQQPRRRARSRSRPASRAPERAATSGRLARNARALDEHLDAVEQGEIVVVAKRPVGGDDLRPARLERGLRRPARAREPEDERPPQSRNWR